MSQPRSWAGAKNLEMREGITGSRPTERAINEHRLVERRKKGSWTYI